LSASAAAWRRLFVTAPLVCFVATLAVFAAQAAAMTAVNGAVHVRAPNLRFLQGRVLAQLREGRSVRLDVRLDVLPRRDGMPVASADHSFNISFDVWEERFAVTHLGQPPRSVSHLTLSAAETWCLDNVTLPLADIRMEQRSAAWMRVTVRPRNDAEPPGGDRDGPLSIRRLIDALSRPRERDEPPATIQAGPFNLSN
jgi:hypothetical protein